MGSRELQAESIAPLSRVHGWRDGLAIILLLLLAFTMGLMISALSPDQALIYFLSGTGVYVLLLGVGGVAAGWAGWTLHRSGSGKPPALSTRASRDELLISRAGGLALLSLGIGLTLVALRSAQNRLLSAEPPGKTMGLFDLLTWLGTFGTLAIVIATALVAMWVRRRDDEAQHDMSIRGMRQAWIDVSRKLLAKLLVDGRALYEAMESEEPRPELAQNALTRFRQLQLQLNPTEGHHEVLIVALRGWLHEAGLNAHLKGKPESKLPARTDFDQVADWIVALGQLVLKIEWVVTSQGRDAIPDKADALWKSLQNFEQKYAEEIGRVAPQALQRRRDRAHALISD